MADMPDVARAAADRFIQGVHDGARARACGAPRTGFSDLIAAGAAPVAHADEWTAGWLWGWEVPRLGSCPSDVIDRVRDRQRYLHRAVADLVDARSVDAPQPARVAGA